MAAIGLGALALSGAIACQKGSGAVPADPAAKEIARVGDHGVTRGQFDAWLAVTMGGAAETVAATADLKSRLLDQYLDEELLVTAARERGLTVTPEELGKLTAAAGASSGGEAETLARSLLQKKFKEQVILKEVSVGPDEVRAYFEQHLEEYRRPARVVLRQILIDTETEAKRIRDDLARRPGRFEEIAGTRSLAPDGGKPTALDEAILPETIRGAVASMKEGELSPVVKDPQGFFILKLEERQPARAPSLEAAREPIELKLLQARSQKKYREFVAALREKIKVRINEDALDFPYVRRSGS
jgi:parvulin-like peptidyl-prolyl isomerase